MIACGFTRNRKRNALLGIDRRGLHQQIEYRQPKLFVGVRLPLDGNGCAFPSAGLLPLQHQRKALTRFRLSIQFHHAIALRIDGDDNIDFAHAACKFADT